MLESNFAISELQRKLANIVRIGLIKAIDYEKAKVRVKIGEFLTDYLPWITMRAGKDTSWTPPDIDEQVIVLSPFGELSLGVALPAIYQQKYLPYERQENADIFEFKDGTRLSYDKENHHLEVSVMNKITLKVGESEIEITKNGIKLKATRIDLN